MSPNDHKKLEKSVGTTEKVGNVRGGKLTNKRRNKMENDKTISHTAKKKDPKVCEFNKILL